MLETSTFYPQNVKFCYNFLDLVEYACVSLDGRAYLLLPSFPDTINQIDFQFLLPLRLSLP